MPLDYTALLAKADAAGEAAPVEDGYAVVKVKINTNLYRWVRNKNVNLRFPLGYAKAYVAVLRHAGEFASIKKE